MASTTVQIARPPDEVFARVNKTLLLVGNGYMALRGLRRRRKAGWRSFDPVRLGELETAAWAGYYRREWLRVLRSFVLLMREAFGFSWPATLRGAWYVLRANQLWAPVPDNDPDGAREQMRRFYELLRGRYGSPADARRAAELEVEWWRLHRADQYSGEDGSAPLTHALSASYAYLYGIEEQATLPAARERVEAMRLSDAWVSAGCGVSDPRLEQERAALVRSYAFLLAAVHSPT